MQGWGDLLAGREQRARLEGTKRTVPELLETLEMIAADLHRSVMTHSPDE
jgi:hypothetical protein